MRHLNTPNLSPVPRCMDYWCTHVIYMQNILSESTPHCVHSEIWSKSTALMDLFGLCMMFCVLSSGSILTRTYAYSHILALPCTTQENYAIQDSSGMCHFIPRRHLPEWREEDERAFAHCGSSGLNHTITSESATDLSKVSSVTLWWLHVNAIDNVWYSVV